MVLNGGVQVQSGASRNLETGVACVAVQATHAAVHSGRCGQHMAGDGVGRY
jgi:hypothetical protein